MTIEERVKLITDADMSWDWDSSNPTYNDKTPNVDYGGTTRFDPFPCYAHKRDYVIEMAKQVEKSFPIGFDVFYFLFSHEPISRVNGQASKNTKWEREGGKSVWDGVIHLYGKRIPLAPSMTRYLVSHEYFHHIDNWICHQRGLKDNGLDEEYAKMRGIPLNQGYGGRKWSSNLGEILCNDGRICVAGTEPEFWPHDCKHPLEDDNVKNWWYEAALNYSLNP